MNKLTIDFETRSPVSLKDAGAWKYAAHPYTEALCLAVKANDKPPVIWVPDWLRMKLENAGVWGRIAGRAVECETVQRSIAVADVIEAHNMTFERAMWFYYLTGKYFFPMLPVEKLRCSAAKAAAHGLPRSLDQAGKALGLPVQKDAEGHRLMLKMCKPRKARKEGRKRLEALRYIEQEDNGWCFARTGDTRYFWHEDPADFIRLFEYCLQDVEAEHALSSALRDLSPVELKVWQLDQEINARGIYADVTAATAAKEMIAAHTIEAGTRAEEITGGIGVKQVAALLEWMKGEGVDLPNLQAETVKQALSGDHLPAHVREVLEIRQSLSKSSTAKYDAIISRAGADNRIRDFLIYCGAGRTGRWSGAGIQPQNMPRGTFKDADLALELFGAGKIDLLQLLFGDPMETASTCIRAMLTAAPGHDLVCADFSSIEAIGLAWLAGQREVLDAFVARKDLYKVAAQDVYAKTYEEITKDERQIGKVVVLACGYQGRVGAFQSMAKTYGVYVDDEKAAEIVDRWREKNALIVKMWDQVEVAARSALLDRGRRYSYRGVSFLYTPHPHPGFLCCKLPSGRVLYYCAPVMEDEGWKKSITYTGIDTYTHKWKRIKTYGGKLVENITQAVCRDLIAEAMLRVEAAGYPVVLSVHDELVSEVPENFGSLEEYEQLMAEVPAWASGLPVRAAGWRGKRYRK